MKAGKIICKNVFKTKNQEDLPKIFTLKWTELINQFEKGKEIVNVANVK